MKYWDLRVSNDGSSVVSADIRRDFSQQTVFADTTYKDGEVEGDLKDDHPLFGAPEEIFSQRLTDEILKFNPEGIMTRPVTLTLPDGSLNHNFCEVTVSAYVDCIDFNASKLKFYEDDGSIRFIKKLVLNAEKAQQTNYDIFRLHDYFPTIIVSDRLKQVIEAINPIGIRFKPTDGSE